VDSQSGALPPSRKRAFGPSVPTKRTGLGQRPNSTVACARGSKRRRSTSPWTRRWARHSISKAVLLAASGTSVPRRGARSRSLWWMGPQPGCTGRAGGRAAGRPPF